MSKASGLLLILAGLGAAAYVMPSGGDPGERQEPQQVDVAKSVPASDVRVVSVREGKRVDERAGQTAMIPPQPQPAVKPAVQPTAKSAAQPATPAANAAPPLAGPVVITLAQRVSEPSRLPVAPPQKAASTPGDRASLARELQKELKRVGCYEGEINATWTTSSRRAMKIFTDRVNATLPIDEPDYILLALVQSQQDKVCGKPCPAGQGLSEDGRCMPAAILAQAAKKAPAPAAATARNTPPTTERPAATITGWSTNTTAVAPTLPSPPPPEGRMALAGPKIETRPIPSVGPPMPSAGMPVTSLPVRPSQRDVVVTYRGGPPVGVYERVAPRYVQPAPVQASWQRRFHSNASRVSPN